MTLQEIKTLFESMGIPCFHGFRKPSSDQYLIWEEEGTKGTHADNIKATRIMTGTLDLFTRTEFDPAVSQIETKLNNSKMAWEYNSIPYDAENEYYHHEWVWEVILNG